MKHFSIKNLYFIKYCGKSKKQFPVFYIYYIFAKNNTLILFSALYIILYVIK